MKHDRNGKRQEEEEEEAVAEAKVRARALINHVKSRLVQDTKANSDDDERVKSEDFLSLLQSLKVVVDFLSVITGNVSHVAHAVLHQVNRAVSRIVGTSQSYEASILQLLTSLLSPLEYLMDQYNDFMYGGYDYGYDQRLYVTRIYRWLEQKVAQWNMRARRRLNQLLLNSNYTTSETEDEKAEDLHENRKNKRQKDKLKGKENLSQKAETNSTVKPSSNYGRFYRWFLFAVRTVAFSGILLFWRLLYLRWRTSPLVSQFDEPSFMQSHVEQMYVDPMTKQEYDSEARRFYQNRYQRRSYGRMQERQNFLTYFPSNRERRMELKFGRNPQVPTGIAPINEEEEARYHNVYSSSSPFGYSSPSYYASSPYQSYQSPTGADYDYGSGYYDSY